MGTLLNGESAYASLTLYVGGNALAVGAGFVLLSVWRILAGFQEPIIWGVICSLALRDTKDHLVQYLESELKSKSLLQFLISLALLPVSSLLGYSPSFLRNVKHGKEETPTGSASTPRDGNKTVTSGFIIGWLMRAVFLYAMFGSIKSWVLQSSSGMLLSAIAIGICALIAMVVYDRSSPALGQSGDEEDATMSSEGDHSQEKSSKGAEGSNDRSERTESKSRPMMHSIVAVGLIVSVVLGSIAGSFFISYKIVDETRCAVSKMHEAINASPQKENLGGVLDSLRGYQEEALLTVQANMPNIQEVVKDKIEGYFTANNLSHIVDDAKEMFTLILGTEPCTKAMKADLVINLAAARLSAHTLQQNHDEHSELLHEQQALFESNLTAWEIARTSGKSKENYMDNSAIDIDLELIHSEKHVKETAAELDKITRELENVNETLRMANFKLEKCEALEEGKDSQDKPMDDMRRKLSAIYGNLMSWNVSGAYAELQSLSGLAESASGSMDSLRDAATLVALPLLTVGQGMARAFTKTATLVLSSGASLFRMSMSLINFMLEFVLFATILVSLLSAEQNPFMHVLLLLPVSEENRLRALEAIGQAIQSVISSAVKLATFHALFTWLSLTAFGADFPCLFAVASIVVSLLPLAPIWTISLPAALQLFLLGNRVMAVVLVLLHYFASGYVDDIILDEIPGTVPYLTGLGIVGGISTFDNPLKGAIMGPMLIALLSVAYKLHWIFLSSGNTEDRGTSDSTVK